MPHFHPLRFSPRALRFFVLALAWLQFAAPTWHICEMGGLTNAKSSAAHHASASASASAANDKPLDPNTPIICFCAPKLPPPLVAGTPHLGGLESHDHATCLALLLQTLPGQIGAAIPFFERLSVVGDGFQTRSISALFCAAPRRFRGRAPPQIC